MTECNISQGASNTFSIFTFIVVMQEHADSPSWFAGVDHHFRGKENVHDNYELTENSRAADHTDALVARMEGYRHEMTPSMRGGAAEYTPFFKI